MLLVNGINVYPREIEEILYQFPGVKEAAVIGKPDLRKGEQPIAYVAPNDDVPLEEKTLQHFVRERLADYKTARKVIILPSLPRTATGKILKTALRDLPLAKVLRSLCNATLISKNLHRFGSRARKTSVKRFWS